MAFIFEIDQLPLSGNCFFFGIKFLIKKSTIFITTNLQPIKCPLYLIKKVAISIHLED